MGRDAGGSFTTPEILLSEEDLKHLDAIHEEFQIASDKYALDGELAKRLQGEFARRSNQIVPAMILAAAMVRRRKAGALATLRPKTDDSDLGFSDIDKVAEK